MISERVKALRKGLKMTQSEFGIELGVSRDVISNLEYGRVAPSELIINMICARFDVNREWLESGTGAMYREYTREEEIAAWAASLNFSDNDFKRRFVYALTRLDETGWAVIERFVQTLYEEQLAEDSQNKKTEGE